VEDARQLVTRAKEAAPRAKNAAEGKSAALTVGYLTSTRPQLRSASNYCSILFDLDSVERLALQIADASRRIDSVVGMADEIMKSGHLVSPVHSGQHVYLCFWFGKKFAAATPAACPVAKAVPMTHTEEPAY
jgi:hypothetical protein